MANSPNFLILTFDDMRFDACEAGSPSFFLPDVTGKLLKRGVYFPHAFCTATYCKPARTVMMTGGYPHQTGLYTNKVGQPNPLPNGVALPQLMRDNGYRTVHFGKSHFGYPIENLGFQVVDRDTGPAMISNAQQFLRSSEAKNKPFLLNLATSEPHAPWNPSSGYSGYYQNEEYPLRPNVAASLNGKPAFQQLAANEGQARAQQSYGTTDPRTITNLYYGECSEILDTIEAIGKTLLQEDLERDTVILLLSDNGMLVGNHSIFFKLGCGYEEMLRMPFMVLWGGNGASGHVSNTPVNLVDLAPTILDMAGIPAPSFYHGHSLKASIEGQAQPECRFVVVESGIDDGSNGMIRVLRTRLDAVLPGEWTLVLNQGDLKELYDLSNDPYQLNNIAEDPAFLGQRLTLESELQSWMNQTGDQDGLAAFFGA